MIDNTANIIINDVDLAENEVKNVSVISGVTVGESSGSSSSGGSSTVSPFSLQITTPDGTKGNIKINTNTVSNGKAGNIEIVTQNGASSTEGGKISIHSGERKANRGEVEIYGAASDKDTRYLRFQTITNDVPYAKAKIDEAETLNVVIPDKNNLSSQCRLVWTANGLEIIKEVVDVAE